MKCGKSRIVVVFRHLTSVYWHQSLTTLQTNFSCPSAARAEELSNLIPDEYEPQFDNNTEREIIAALGTTARMHCRVRHLGDRAVSWIRQRDLHILTIGIMTYTNDQRFLARHIDNSDEWVLKIVSVQPRDAGVYECQVSTEPKISLAYKLMVVSKYLRTHSETCSWALYGPKALETWKFNIEASIGVWLLS